mmetsp:Transcript_40227/g.86312  ORF Transcript_40227/g.86312 Transcript_40227/m.86312 type:complete len:220 (+) Transcript_40227:1066-1725(+)
MKTGTGTTTTTIPTTRSPWQHIDRVDQVDEVTRRSKHEENESRRRRTRKKKKKKKKKEEKTTGKGRRVWCDEAWLSSWCRTANANGWVSNGQMRAMEEPEEHDPHTSGALIGIAASTNARRRTCWLRVAVGRRRTARCNSSGSRKVLGIVQSNAQGCRLICKLSSDGQPQKSAGGVVCATLKGVCPPSCRGWSARPLDPDMLSRASDLGWMEVDKRSDR